VSSVKLMKASDVFRARVIARQDAPKDEERLLEVLGCVCVCVCVCSVSPEVSSGEQREAARLLVLCRRDRSSR
jgi:hypothetical protein